MPKASITFFKPVIQNICTKDLLPVLRQTDRAASLGHGARARFMS
jgi:hypothetical protein